MDRPPSASAAALALLAPGMLHSFGNLMFTVQGHAQLLGSQANGGEQAAILQACARGGELLRLWRWLLGDPQPVRQPAAILLSLLSELLRVPLRERRQSLELDLLAELAGREVDAASFCLAVVESLAWLLPLVPAGVDGSLQLALASGDDGQGIALRMVFRPVAGNLPFPLPRSLPPELLQAIPNRLRPRLRPNGNGLLLLLDAPGAVANRPAAADFPAGGYCTEA